MKEVKTGKKRPKRKASVELPELMTHRQAADIFCVTSAGLRKWVEKGQFPRPHSVICQTWYYRVDVIAHRVRTGEWPHGVRFVEL